MTTNRTLIRYRWKRRLFASARAVENVVSAANGWKRQTQSHVQRGTVVRTAVARPDGKTIRMYDGMQVRDVEMCTDCFWFFLTRSVPKLKPTKRPHLIFFWNPTRPSPVRYIYYVIYCYKNHTDRWYIRILIIFCDKPTPVVTSGTFPYPTPTTGVSIVLLYYI
jgi:hypothetical protein